ncbi:hypothetical protein O9993_00855 [Vibrio lentus]|nr:hypothetical protein [Vibrio lentus]
MVSFAMDFYQQKYASRDAIPIGHQSIRSMILTLSSYSGKPVAAYFKRLGVARAKLVSPTVTGLQRPSSSFLLTFIWPRRTCSALLRRQRV